MPGSNSNSGQRDYIVTNSGTNSQGSHWCNRQYEGYSANTNAFHYSNRDGSYFYNNPDGSKYYNNGKGFSSYTPPPSKGQRQKLDLKAVSFPGNWPSGRLKLFLHPALWTRFAGGRLRNSGHEITPAKLELPTARTSGSVHRLQYKHSLRAYY
ncbi:hypothetical protein BDV98DRAFT_583908 [Pterulicium gracile]|uniref:Uncharacterized protein n=1 Tax=Pterulicium gracile TaxID=1884261 RepID=A0A5C3QCY1_9AGAR|nr:hypothetical protein BDV98DRAFT_583908 [Pterula gracilis]